MVDEKEIWIILEKVCDPEVPVLTILDLGIVRDVSIDAEGKIQVSITPTYTGCPAMFRIEQDIKEELGNSGFQNVEVKHIISPAWSTDWLTENGRRKLKEYGIAPPVNEPDKSVLFADPIVVPCPKCDSKDTKMVSQFGSTACKAHYQCNTCLEPFDYFKCLK